MTSKNLLLLILFLTANACFSQTTNINGFEIDDIVFEFTDKKSYDEDEINNIITLPQRDLFDIEEYLTDVQRIEKFYFDNGYFDAKVDTSIYVNFQDKIVVPKFIITENTRYKYEEIKYLGLEIVTEDVKEKIFSKEYQKIKLGNYYEKQFILDEQNRVLDTLLNFGYARATAKNPQILKYESDLRELKNKVEVRLIYEPKDQYYYGQTRIDIKGKRYNVTDEDILRELLYKEGDLYKKSDVVKSELALSKITILENPRILIDNFDSVSHKINFVIDAEIKNKYELTPEILGYEIDNNFYTGAGLSFTDKFFFGGGRVLNSHLRFLLHSTNDYRVEFLTQVYQPFLFGKKDISGNVSLGAEYYTDEQYEITTINNSYTVNIDFPRYTYINKLTTDWKIRNFRISSKKDIIDPQQSDSVLEKFTFNAFTSTLSVTAIHNRVNNLQFPYKGIYQVYSVEESGLLGALIKNLFNTSTYRYIKLTSFNTAYFNLSSSDILEKVNSALALKFLTGVIFEYGDNRFFFLGEEVTDDVVPLDAKFVAGGSSSVRGWKGKHLGIVPDKKIGGNFILEGSVEHRLRPFLEKKNFLKELGFATFFDFGNVWTDVKEFKLNEVALAIGGGIRYYTIIGAIRLDIGFKLYDPQPGPVGGSHWLFGSGANFSDKYNFQFGLGNTF